MMDPIKAAREMGKAIQNSPEYIAMKEAEKPATAMQNFRN